MKKFVSFLILFLLTIVSAEAAKQPRIKYYLTQNTFTGSQALTACADGYHMASLWEIFDTSHLKYDTTLGATADDSGSGPPNSIEGWIRTGSPSFGNTGVPGGDNCLVWTSNSSPDRGTVVFLNFNWENPFLMPIDPWRGATFPCDSSRRVWCVQD